MKKSLLFSFALMGVIGIVTFVPLVIFIKLGEYLDGHFSTAPYISYASILVATIQIFFYVIAISKRASRVFEEINS